MCDREGKNAGVKEKARERMRSRASKEEFTDIKSFTQKGCKSVTEFSSVKCMR